LAAFSESSWKEAGQGADKSCELLTELLSLKEKLKAGRVQSGEYKDALLKDLASLQGQLKVVRAQSTTRKCDMETKLSSLKKQLMVGPTEHEREILSNLSELKEQHGAVVVDLKAQIAAMTAHVSKLLPTDAVFRCKTSGRCAVKL
jgi:hypothetical protein